MMVRYSNSGSAQTNSVAAKKNTGGTNSSIVSVKFTDCFH
jgi:hypothetical protein